MTRAGNDGISATAGFAQEVNARIRSYFSLIAPLIEGPSLRVSDLLTLAMQSEISAPILASRPASRDGQTLVASNTGIEVVHV